MMKKPKSRLILKIIVCTEEILESCEHYINCPLHSDGSYTQWNMKCPGDLVFANGKLSWLGYLVFYCLSVGRV